MIPYKFEVSYGTLDLEPEEIEACLKTISTQMKKTYNTLQF
ncbi:hypothetical protein PM10SUCC1_21450 [Propionigenium maris DSM 9537]|uniref:Uncharacterized protein n=1 Tax=Propionigenium maris DSM 9537 TaxID=1123000 RepID=A0A9W6GMW6_9FUSO|nr:hypothetical protein PM10SUCC1_21450 [Propionigenium maris DSM 9537]